MSITIELPPDLERDVREIPNVEASVVSFLRDQAEYHKWRKARYSDEARRIVSDGLAEADRLKAAGVPREEMFRRFFAVYDRISVQLVEKE